MYVMMAILGAANLVPWMAFLAMADFFRELYGSNAMEFYFPIVSTSVLVVTSALTLAFGDRYPFRYRIVLPTLVLCFSILAVPLLSIAINARLVSKSSAFRLTLASVLVNAFCSSVAQISLYGLGAVMSGNATQALQAGTGAMGVVTVLLRAITKLAMASERSTWLFCGLGSILLLTSVYMCNCNTPTPPPQHPHPNSPILTPSPYTTPILTPSPYTTPTLIPTLAPASLTLLTLTACLRYPNTPRCF